MARQCIQSVPLWNKFCIHFFSFIFGLWVLCKRLGRCLWETTQNRGVDDHNSVQTPDTPPACLVDSSLGQHKYVKLKGVKLHYVEAGDKDQPLLLLLHGFPDFWLSWRYQIPILSEHFHVAALDLKGFGDSDKPQWRYAYRLETILEELEQFIYSFDVENCIVIGHDLGALLGWYLVHKTPCIVNTFFAVSSPHPNESWKTMNNWLNFVQLPYLPEIDAMREDVKIIKKYHKHLKNNDFHLEAYKYTFSRKEDWTGPINYYRNLPFLKMNADVDEITVPTTLITGNKDKFVDIEAIVASTEFCDRFHLKIIDGAGHFPHQEKPEIFNATLLKYLLPEKNSLNKNSEFKSPSKRLIKGLFGAVTNTVKYGNSVIDSVQKGANGVVNSIPALSLNFNANNGKPK